MASKAVTKKKRKHVNLNVQATFLHLLGDALGSLSLIVSGFLIRYGEPVFGTSPSSHPPTHPPTQPLAAHSSSFQSPFLPLPF